PEHHHVQVVHLMTDRRHSPGHVEFGRGAEIHRRICTDSTGRSDNRCQRLWYPTSGHVYYSSLITRVNRPQVIAREITTIPNYTHRLDHTELDLHQVAECTPPSGTV